MLALVVIDAVIHRCCWVREGRSDCRKIARIVPRAIPVWFATMAVRSASAA
jgi:hypothetical protein